MAKRQRFARHMPSLVLAVLVAGASAVPAHAAVPTFVQVEGALFATGGGPVADGNYALTFKLFAVESGGQAVWSEGPVQAAVKGGSFSHALGSQEALTPQVLAQQAVWLAVQVGADPELARKPMSASPFALRAALAEGLDCSGCVALSHLSADVLAPYAKSASLAKVAATGNYADLAGAPDLTVFAKTSALATVALTGKFADLDGGPDLSAYTKTSALAAVALSGAYADLDGLPNQAKLGVSCGTGLVIKGLKADGSYECVVAMDPTALPGDGLDEISSGALTNQFTDVVKSAKTGIGIPDNNPVGVSDSVDVPDLGIAQALTVSVDLANSDTANLKILLLDPTGAKYTLVASLPVSDRPVCPWPPWSPDLPSLPWPGFWPCPLPIMFSIIFIMAPPDLPPPCCCFSLAAAWIFSMISVCAARVSPPVSALARRSVASSMMTSTSLSNSMTLGMVCSMTSCCTSAESSSCSSATLTAPSWCLTRLSSRGSSAAAGASAAHRTQMPVVMS